MSPETLRSVLSQRAFNNPIEVLVRRDNQIPDALFQDVSSPAARRDVIRKFMRREKDALIKALLLHPDIKIINRLSGTTDVHIVGTPPYLVALLNDLERRFPGQIKAYENDAIYSIAGE